MLRACQVPPIWAWKLGLLKARVLGCATGGGTPLGSDLRVSEAGALFALHFSFRPPSVWVLAAAAAARAATRAKSQLPRVGGVPGGVGGLAPMALQLGRTARRWHRHSTKKKRALAKFAWCLKVNSAVPLKTAKKLGWGKPNADPTAWFAPTIVGRCYDIMECEEQVTVIFNDGYQWVAGANADTEVWELMCWARYMQAGRVPELLRDSAVFLCYRNRDGVWEPCTDVEAEILSLPMHRGLRSFKASIVTGPAWLGWWDRVTRQTVASAAR